MTGRYEQSEVVLCYHTVGIEGLRARRCRS